MQHHVTVYTTKLCPICGMVKDFLEQANISFKEVSVDLNPIALIKLIGKTGKFTVPQTNLNGKWVSGFDPVRMLQAVSAEEDR